MSEERLQGPPPQLRPGGAFLLVLIHLAGVMSVGILAINLASDHSILLFISAGVVVGPLIALYVGLNRYTPHLKTREALGLVMPRGRQWALLGLAVVAGAALAPIAVEITVRIFRLWPLDDQGDVLAEPTDAGGWIILAVAQLVVSPIAQEALFRGLILGKLRESVGERYALFVATVLYVAAILQPHVMPMALLLALMTGVFALRSRCLWLPIAAHISTRCVEVLLLWEHEWPSKTDPGPPDQPIWVLAVAAAVLVSAAAAAWKLAPRDAPR